MLTNIEIIVCLVLKILSDDVKYKNYIALLGSHITKRNLNWALIFTSRKGVCAAPCIYGNSYL